jgi:PhoH-like ATPase
MQPVEDLLAVERAAERATEEPLVRESQEPGEEVGGGPAGLVDGGGGGGGGRGGGSSRERLREGGLVAPSREGKNFLLDTNVLLHDPACLTRFGANHLAIPVDVLGELDRFKNEQSDRGAGARAVHRLLGELLGDAGRSVTRGVGLPEGGSLRFVLFDPEAGGEEMGRFLRIFPDRASVDNRILGSALLVKRHNEGPTVLVTKDLNMQLKARALGIDCEDYRNDKVSPVEVQNYAIRRVEVGSHELQRLGSTGYLLLGDGHGELEMNQYVLVLAGQKSTLPARHVGGGELVRLRVPDALKNPRGLRLRPINLGQQCLLDALLDPDITLVTCFGQAGTGKTLAAVAAGLHSVFEKIYTGLTISRPVVPMGETVGFLPGDLDEKMRPWLQPVYDALDYLMPPVAAGGKKGGDGKVGVGPMARPHEALIEAGMLEVEALCYIRGRSIPNRYFILDEAQQLSPLEAKTVVTRMSEGSKLVMIGDPAQIDNPYVDSRSNGLVYTRQRLRGEPIAAHITLDRGERSALAEAGARLM